MEEGTGDSSTPVQWEGKDRILRRGDLARILGIQKGKLNDHKGDLSRVVRSHLNPDWSAGLEQNGHAYLYDIELVLGGKLNGVPRCELLYTTAFEEGMTGDSRQRRKRKQNPPKEEKKNDKNAKNASSSSGMKKKKTTATGGKVAATKSIGNNRKRGKVTISATTSSTNRNNTTNGTGIGMFEKHRREFERCLNRLEKLDVYLFFSEHDIPPEFDECYDRQDPVSENESSAASPTTTEKKQIPDDMPMQPPSSSTEVPGDKEGKSASVLFPNHPPYNFIVLRKRLEQNRYIIDRQRLTEAEENFHADGTKVDASDATKKGSSNFSQQHPFGINWELFRDDVIGMCNAAVERNKGNFDDGTPGTLSNSAEKIKSSMEQIYEKTGRRQVQEMEVSNDALRFSKIMEATENKEAAMQGKGWRKRAFPERQYERLTTDAVCAGLSELDERIATYELQTNLKDSFIGLSYTYNDTGQSEGWMKTIISEGDDKNEQEKAARALSTDDGVIKAQVMASMQSLLIAVQDRVMTENGVLEQKELRSASWAIGIEKVGEQIVSSKQLDSDASQPEIVEQPVWGMDCYTRKNISICLGTKFDKDVVLVFIEKWLLPAINACPVDLAYNLSNAARILEGLPLDTASSLNQRKATTTELWSTTLLGKALLKKIEETGPPWLHCAARILRKAIESMGHDFFRVHPKGHGSIVLSPKIAPNRLVTFYRGEVYPSWRWGEKMDAISLIQQRNNLKPRLPDFYNMALERPQQDPRGYGLLFVDASRKSGYGSMLSHSCNPSCEVRVAAVNGKLTLAMTTLRELTIGDEVTFDYNAVTESLHEYQAAVCLCGQVHCRGSFLHFATADCYQQVLNRNSPIAVRLAQLIKGCTKRVMSDDDIAILERHGFQTAAFGAVSVNRRKTTNSDFERSSLDSMDFVPIWLRTHVADILRYIEYERRALPIALISNQISNHKSVDDSGTNDKKKRVNVANVKEASQSNAAPKSIDDKPVKGSKPQPTFFYYLQRKRESFISQLLEERKNESMTGGEIEREMKKLASAEWKSFDDEMKQHWKEQAIAEWEKNGGKKKAVLEQQRLKRLSQSKNSKNKHNTCEPKKSTNTKTQESPAGNDGLLETKKISFQAADAEGVTAMEQRIQQLTQSLSRVGRVLDRHREELLRKQQSEKSTEKVHSPAELRELAHSPLAIMPDEHVVAFMWNHENGIIRTLLRMAKQEVCVSPQINSALEDVESNYTSLAGFGRPWEKGADIDFPMPPQKGRELLNEALLKFRTTLLDGIRDMATDIKNLRASARENAREKREREEKRKQRAEKISKISTSCSDTEIRSAIKFVLNGLIDTIEGDDSDSEVDSNDPNISEPWLNNYNKRFKMEKAADLLLLYRRTSTFFRLVPYESLQSSPIEVYAREVGNSVPRSVMDIKETSEGMDRDELKKPDQDIEMADENHNKAKPSTEVKRTGVCEPEDIISEVVVDYQGDYIFSQILQWYNAGIGQKPGIPDIIGCALLPSMSGCWTIDTTKGSNAATGTRTKYQSNIRPKLVEWFKDPFKRGSPWTEDLRRGFVDKDDDSIEKASKFWLPIGSPVLDFLVTGDDCNLMDALRQLGTDPFSVENSGSDGLLSSVDHGRPAQAVCNWVQCEKPDCKKWRKIPWHVDIDIISKSFVCADHIWGLDPPSCDAPEDVWDETTDACVEADGSVKPKGVDKSTSPVVCSDQFPKVSRDIKDFKIGDRFDILRPGKEKWSIASVVDVALDSKKIQFHFVKTQSKNDVWLEEHSYRIATLHTHTSQSKQKAPTKIQLPSISETSEKASKLEKLKKIKASQNQQRIAKQLSKSNESSEKDVQFRSTTNKTENRKTNFRIEDDDDDDEGLFDVISSEDEDDDEENHEMEHETEITDIRSNGGSDKERVEKRSTVTDHSSSDSSFKKETNVVRSEHSDVENDCTKLSAKTKSAFTIPKKERGKRSSSIVIPKKNAIPKKPQSSSSVGTSLISKAMLEGKVKKKSRSPAKKSLLSLSPSATKERSNHRKHEISGTSSSPLKRKTFSEMSKTTTLTSPPTTRVKRDQIEINNGNKSRSPLSKAMVNPRRSYNDRYSIEQRRERELYRDSNEYSVRRNSDHYRDSSDTNDYSDRRTNDSNNLSQRGSSMDRRRVDHSDQNISPRRNYDSRGHDEYGDDEYRSRHSDHSRYKHEDDVYRSRQYDSYHNEDNVERSRNKSSDYSPRRISYRREGKHEQYSDEYFHDRRMSGSDRRRSEREGYYDYDGRIVDDSDPYVSRRPEAEYRRRGTDVDRDVNRDEYRHRLDEEDERSFRSHFDAEDYRRVDDRQSKRRRHDSSSRREERRRRTFDGSDEYSRRLQSYNFSQEHDYPNEDFRHRDRRR